LALLFAAILVWRKIRIVMLVHVSVWQVLLLVLVLALVVYLIFEVLLRGPGGP
jgi:hypothetical protein